MGMEGTMSIRCASSGEGSGVADARARRAEVTAEMEASASSDPVVCG
jgi:hypothetical protein